MAYDGRHNKLRRKDAIGMEELVSQFVKDMKLTSGLNQQRAAEAWNVVSGAGKYTLSVTLERGIMTCYINSSLVRNQLYFQKEMLLKSVNDYLSKDSLYSGVSDEPAVKVLILK